jgi:hypothetical protein
LYYENQYRFTAAKAMQWFGTVYAHSFNLKNNIGGHLFQGVGRFALKAPDLFEVYILPNNLT